MMLVGLTGGVATGKTTVAEMFRRCGATVIDADVLARQVVEPNKPAWREIVKTFGRSVLNRNRTINRHALGAIVFRDRARLKRLERIIHPRVAAQQARLTRSAASKDPHAVVIYDVPLLFEAGIDKQVDVSIVVTADQATQITRLKMRNGLSRAESIRRVKSQIPLTTKCRRADYVLDGTTRRSELRRAVHDLYRKLQAEA